MATTSIEKLKELRANPSDFTWNEYFASRPEVLARFNDPKTIIDVLPQAVDSEHPFHDGFWNILFNGGFQIDTEDIGMLCEEVKRLNEEGGEAKREQARIVSEKYVAWNDW